MRTPLTRIPLPHDMPTRGYVQDPKTGVTRLRTPKLRGKAAVKAAKRARTRAQRCS